MSPLVAGDVSTGTASTTTAFVVSVAVLSAPVLSALAVPSSSEDPNFSQPEMMKKLKATMRGRKAAKLIGSRPFDGVARVVYPLGNNTLRSIGRTRSTIDSQ